MRKLSTKITEHQEQCTVFQWASLNLGRYPELKYMFGTLNGVPLKIWQAAKAKRAGNKKGVPDIILPYKNGTYSGLFLELKIPGGSVKPEQKEYIEYLRTQGYFADIRVGSQEAIDLIVDYMENLL